MFDLLQTEMEGGDQILAEEKEEISAEVIIGRITKIEGRKVTVKIKKKYGEEVTAIYELAVNSPLRPRDLIDYMGDLISIIVVNGKIYNIK
jgi:intergrase/recombinase